MNLPVIGAPPAERSADVQQTKIGHRHQEGGQSAQCERSLNEATNAACNMRSMAKPASAMIKAFGACSIKREKAGDSSPKITASNPVKIPAV